MEQNPESHKVADRATPVLRFAPSPNGWLHLGHAYSALLNQSLARHLGGEVLLRFEDIDRQRCREAYFAAIEEDLGWLGFVSATPARRQSEHFATYASALHGLERRGLVYPCFCSRGEAVAAAGRPDWPRDPDGMPLYGGLCRDLGASERRRRREDGQPFRWRLDMGASLGLLDGPIDWAERSFARVAIEHDVARKSLATPRHPAPDGTIRRIAAHPARWGDAAIGRKDVPTSYHLAVVVDDALQGVTDVVRGQDLFEATALQRLLQTLLGLPAPRYHHHRIILDESGHKLSKSRRARSLRDLRAEGWSPAAIRERLGVPA